MTDWILILLSDPKRQQPRHRSGDLNARGEVRGWHEGCPATEPPFLGTYALVPGPKGRVDCAACGAIDLS